MRGVGGFHFIEKCEAFAGDMVADRGIIQCVVVAKCLADMTGHCAEFVVGQFGPCTAGS